MSRGQRIGLVALAVAGLAIGFALARPGGDDDDEDRAAPTTSAPAPPAAATTEATPTIGTETETEPETETATESETETETETTPPQPQILTVRTRNGKPVGGVRELRVESGETVRFAVTSNVAEEVHVHGYDLSKDVGPGKPARFRFRAELEGIFEIELEEAGEPIIELRVEP